MGIIVSIVTGIGVYRATVLYKNGECSQFKKEVMLIAILVLCHFFSKMLGG